MKTRFYVFLQITSLLFIVSCTHNESHSVNIYLYTNDFEAILTDEQRTILNTALSELEKSIGSQIVVITTSLNGETIEEYSYRMANEIEVGRAGYNDGILITVAPMDRITRIEVGSGLECIITDSIATHIIDTKMIPHFRDGEYFEGLEASVDDLINRLYENQSEIGLCESNPDFDGEMIRIE